MLNDINVVEEKEFSERVNLTIPKDWWTISASYPILNENHKTSGKIKLIRLTDFNRKKIEIPKPNYWDISQGDYFVQQESNSFYENLNFRKKLLTILLYFFLLSASTLLYFLT